MVYAVKQFTVQDDDGNIYPSATITVRHDNDEGGLAAIYSDRAGETPLSNPFTADENGFVRFFAPGGAYRIEVTATGFSITHRYEAIGTAAENDADEFGQLQPTLRWQQLVNIDTVDLDTVLTAGFYVGSNFDNAPGDSSDKFYIEVLTNHGSAADAIQIAHSEGATPASYVRCRISATWSEWAALGGGASLSSVNKWDSLQYNEVEELSISSGEIAWDGDAAPNALVELTSNAELLNISNPKHGGIYVIQIVQTSPARTLSLDDRYIWSNEQGEPEMPSGQFESLILTVRCSVWGNVGSGEYDLHITWATFETV